METEEGFATGGGAEGGSGPEALEREFCRMGVADKSELINKMKDALGCTLCPEAAAFYLDMNDWNLQAAIGCYLDLRCTPPPDMIPLPPTQSSALCVTPESGSPTFGPRMRLLESDEIVKIPPGVNLEFVWCVMNNGDNSWPDGCALSTNGLSKVFDVAPKPVISLNPGGIGKLAVNFVTPPLTGLQCQEIRLCTPQGLPFGDALWISVIVEPEHNQQPQDTIADYNMC